MDMERDFELNPSTYEWSVRLFSIVKRMLRVNIKLHHSDALITSGEIFLFNHFARFETFIPQYLIYQETGAFCRSVAGHEFFVEGDAFSNYLINLGAVPNNLPGLLPFLAAEILRGRKVVLFPEGGMVKDRRVIDADGEYSIYSRSAEERRKHHSGAAVLATGLEAFKTTLLCEHAAGHTRHLEEWTERLGLADVDALLAAARRPTMIVPANITFYPIRVSGNFLHKGVELFNRSFNRRGMARRLSEELLIEGNILLKDTDMDIRLGEPVRPADEWRWWEHRLMTRVVRRIDALDGFFALSRPEGRWDARFFARGMRRRILRIRDAYMHRIYGGVTVNLSHLASCIILRLVDRNDTEIDEIELHRMLYLAVKKVQKQPNIYLHRSLRNPESYRGVLEGQCAGLKQFVFTASSMALVEHAGGRYRFLPKLRMEHEFDEIRLENLIAVYANEVGPISEVARAVEEAVHEVASLDERTMARLRFDDERIAYAWDRWYYTKPRYAEINRLETATESGEPFLFAPDERRPLAVVLVHGFLASPAEVREFGERLAERGYPVIGVRLKGHGTSPWDLRERSWGEWLDSVRRGYAIVSAFAERTCLVGFSTGGALSLRLAAERPPALGGVVAINVPVRFRNRNMVFVPLMHGANRFVRSVSSFEGVMAFRPNQSEHPDINYRHMPIGALYELRLLVEDMQKMLPRVQCPVTLIQGDRDPVVEPRSAEIVRDKLGAAGANLIKVSADRHGILNEDIDDTQALVFSLLDELCAREEAGQVMLNSSAKAPT